MSQLDDLLTTARETAGILYLLAATRDAHTATLLRDEAHRLDAARTAFDRNTVLDLDDSATVERLALVLHRKGHDRPLDAPVDTLDSCPFGDEFRHDAASTLAALRAKP